MRCVVILAGAAFGLAGCSSTLSKPPLMQVEFRSTPSGAEAQLSTGQTCTTPCFVELPAPTNDFSVSFFMADYQPMTIPLRVTGSPASLMSPGSTRIEPNPVVVQLQPLAPSKPVNPKGKKPAAQ